jgi:hypothetical protein
MSTIVVVVDTHSVRAVAEKTFDTTPPPVEEALTVAEFELRYAHDADRYSVKVLHGPKSVQDIKDATIYWRG